MPRSLIACRPHSYGPFQSVAYAHLSSLGVRHVEIDLPVADQLESTRALLASHGLRASSLQGRCDVSSPQLAADIEAQMLALAALGTRFLFVSAKAGDTPLDTVYGRLREAGQIAANHNVTIVLETHPDLITNAEVGLATMRGVNHPQVRINFDTANVYFYNHDVDSVDQLRRMLEFVAAVHLKDTNGAYRTWHFPALGRGIVDFKTIFEVLDDTGFDGPCTLEIEGIEGETKTEQLVCDRIAESVAYLRALKRLPDPA